MSYTVSHAKCFQFAHKSEAFFLYFTDLVVTVGLVSVDSFTAY